jgi:hypothetical protein
MKLVQEPRLAQARFAHDQHELTFACPSALPSACEQAQFLLAPDEERQRPRAAPSTAAARANDSEELDRLGNAFEFARGLRLGDEEPRDLALDVHGNEHRARLGSGLHAGGDVRRVAKHLAGRLHDHRPAFDPDPRRKLRRVFAAVLGVDLRESALDRKRCPHRALRVVLLRLGIAEQRH